MKVIPAIDLMDGSVVRLSEGDFSTRKGYSTDPVAVARIFEEGGLSALHVVDLDAARGRGSNIKVLERIASSTALEIDFGGGHGGLGAKKQKGEGEGTLDHSKFLDSSGSRIGDGVNVLCQRRLIRG